MEIRKGNQNFRIVKEAKEKTKKLLHSSPPKKQKPTQHQNPLSILLEKYPRKNYKIPYSQETLNEFNEVLSFTERMIQNMKPLDIDIARDVFENFTSY